MSTPTIDYDALAAQHGGSAQIDYDALAAQHGGTASETHSDSRNWIQRKVDELTNVTPEQEAATKAIPFVGGALNEAQKFGAGAIQGATQPLVHPLDTLQGIGHSLAHPIDTAQAMYQQAMQNPAQMAGNLVGGAVAGEAAGPAVAPIVKGVGKAADALGVPEKLYESALKPSTTMPVGKRAAVIQTGLENEIPISKAGLEDLTNKLTDLRQKTQAVIDADPSRPINTAPAMSNLRDLRAKVANQVNPAADVQAVDQAGKEFAAQAPTGSIPAAQAQEIKQGTYQAIGNKAYGERKTAAVEAQKALARGLKDEIANQFPEIGDWNAQQAKYLGLQPALERAVARSANHQLIGLSAPLVGLGVESVTGHPGAAIAATALKMVVDSPEFKSKLGIALSKAANIPLTQANAKVAAYSSKLGAVVAAGQSANQQTQ